MFWNSLVFPAGTWCLNNVLLTSMRRYEVASMSKRRHFGVMFSLGPDHATVWALQLQSHIMWNMWIAHVLTKLSICKIWLCLDTDFYLKTQAMVILVTFCWHNSLLTANAYSCLVETHIPCVLVSVFVNIYFLCLSISASELRLSYIDSSVC